MPQSRLFTNVIEGDYLETLDGLIFAVKGSFHPRDRIIAYLRYIPDQYGERKRNGTNYRRMYDLDETTEFLDDKFPQYIGYVPKLGLKLQSVPLKNIAKIYKPSEKLRELILHQITDLEKAIMDFAFIISRESGVSMEYMGVSGSVLIGLSTSCSDIDLIVYGRDASLRVYNALPRIKDWVDEVRSYNDSTVEKVLKSRWADSGIDLKRFRDLETKKLLHGMVGGRDFFIRLVKHKEETEREISSSPITKVRLRAFVSSDRNAIFTPCSYEIRDSRILDFGKQYPVSELMSFRGKFTEQSKMGDEIEARGTLEKVVYIDRTILRVVMGGKGDYLVPTRFLD